MTTRQRNMLILNRIKNRPCADCWGWFEPIQMDFDHIAAKTASLAQLSSFADVYALLKELTYCEVVCANCHRLRTFRRKRMGYKVRRLPLPTKEALFLRALIKPL